MKKEIVSIVLARSVAPFPGGAEEYVSYLPNQVRYETEKSFPTRKEEHRPQLLGINF